MIGLFKFINVREKRYIGFLKLVDKAHLESNFKIVGFYVKKLYLCFAILNKRSSSSN